MNTSDEPTAEGAVPSMIPSVAEIARMANEFWKAMPVAPGSVDPIVQPQPSVSSVRPITSGGAPALPQEPSVPATPNALSESELQVLVSSLAGQLGTTTPAVVAVDSESSPLQEGYYFLSTAHQPPDVTRGLARVAAENPGPNTPVESSRGGRSVVDPLATNAADVGPMSVGALGYLGWVDSAAERISHDSVSAVPSGAPSSQIAPDPTPGASFEFLPQLVPDLGSSAKPFDPRSIKRDFPILQQRINGRPLVWLDNAATTQKPQAVIDRLSEFYEKENSNIHRAAHTLAARATDAYEAARDKVRRFLNAGSEREIIFVRGTTEGINLVAQSWGRRQIEAGDEIIVTWLEHHANIVPWQQLCTEKGARLRVVPVDARGQIQLDEFEKLFTSKTKMVALSQVSNALGTITPAREMVQIAHRHGSCVLVDGAQAVSHMPVDVQALDCDFYVFSGHKVFGPTGIGAVYGKSRVLDAMPPWQGGGNMIADVTFEKTIYNAPPFRFEAGTGNIADAVGLGAAIDYVQQLGMDNIARYEHELLSYATERLARVPGLTIIGTAAEKAGVISFVIDGIRTEDIGAALDREGIAVRSGHHCAQPILRRFGLESTVRPSLAPYNTTDDIDTLVSALLRIQADERGVLR